jgi:ankyrin repeat protein
MQAKAKENLNKALFEAVEKGNLNSCLKLIKRGADIESEQKDLTPIFFAAQQGKEEIVRFLLSKGADIGRDEGEVLRILEQAGPAMVRAIGCSDGNSKKNLAQEGINYDIVTKKLEEDQQYKLANINSYIDGNQKIPTISHHIYFSLSSNPRAIDSVSISKTINTLKQLAKTAKWKHYFWTNDASFIPEEIKTIENVEIHLVEELQNSEIYPELIKILSGAKDKSGFVTASDISRIMVLAEHGGIYFDLDYEIYRPEKLFPLTQAFHFFAGKEREEDATGKETRLIGNSVIAASPKHPVIKESMHIIKRNYDFDNQDIIPEYVKFPCSVASKVAYSSGGPVISTAYYRAANQDTIDIILPASSFYNEAYAWSITPESICHRPGIKIDLDKNLIGADMFCGGWTKMEMLYYSENLNEYLFYAALLGYTRIVEYFLNKGADIEYLNKDGVTALYAAAHDGHVDTVEFLLNRGANIERLTAKGANALYISIANGYFDVVNLLLSYGANRNFNQEVNLVKIAIDSYNNKLAILINDKSISIENKKILNQNLINNYNKIIKIVEDGSKWQAKPDSYSGETRQVFAQEDINYDVSNHNLMQDSAYKLSHLSEYKLENKTKIPQITHQMYFSNKNSPQKMDDLSLDITIKTLNRLNEVNNGWKHYFWTNNLQIVPKAILDIENVEVHLIEELSESKLYKELNQILEQAESDKAMFSKASDFLRYTVLKIFGGSYRDLDFEIYRADKFFELMQGFDFLAGKEFDHDPVFIGSASVSSIIDHPIINKALDLLKRNFDSEQIPEYIKFPLNKVWKLVYETGPAVITMAVHKAVNQNGNADLIMPGYHLFNMDYANHINPTSLCHIPNRNLSLDLYPNTISGDLFCGAWHKIKGYENQIYYPHNLLKAVNAADRKAVKNMLENNVSLVKPMEIASDAEYMLEILLPTENQGVRFINCFGSNMEQTFASQGINYAYENLLLIADSAYKKNHIKEFMGEQKIPTITHQIYLSNIHNPKMMDQISEQKTIINAQRLNALENTSWKHIIWTNSLDIIPDNIRSTENIEVKLIDEFETSVLFNDLIKLIEQASGNPKLFVVASDVLRLMALKKYGGIYHDLDYEIFRPEKLFQLTKAFNFFGGKEGAENGPKLTLIGNSIIASSAEHPIINKATEIAYNNMNDLGAKYSKFPCDKSSEFVFKAGGPIITMAYILAANKNGTIDIVMPHQVFYDFDYIRYVTPDSPCHVKGHVATLGEDAIGADMFCGSWHKNNGYKNFNYYLKNNDAYLFEAAIHGYTRIVEFFADKDADINAVGYLKATSLYMAAQNGHVSTVDYLLSRPEIKVNEKAPATGSSPLYIAQFNNHTEIIKNLLMHGADPEIRGEAGITPLYLAANYGRAVDIAWLLKHNASIDVSYDGKTATQVVMKTENLGAIKLLLSGLDVFCAQTSDMQYAEVCGKEVLGENY